MAFQATIFRCLVILEELGEGLHHLCQKDCWGLLSYSAQDAGWMGIVLIMIGPSRKLLSDLGRVEYDLGSGWKHCLGRVLVLGWWGAGFSWRGLDDSTSRCVLQCLCR